MFPGASEKAALTVAALGVRLTQSSTANQATQGAGDCRCAFEQHLCKNKAAGSWCLRPSEEG